MSSHQQRLNTEIALRTVFELDFKDKIPRISEDCIQEHSFILNCGNCGGHSYCIYCGKQGKYSEPIN